MADRRHNENRFLAIYRRHIELNKAKFVAEMKNHTQM